MDPRNLESLDQACGRVAVIGDPQPKQGVATVVDGWPRVPFWDAVVDLSSRPDLQTKDAAARSRLAMEGVGLADERLAREIIGRLLGRMEAGPDASPSHGVQPIWTLFDSLNLGDLNQQVESLSDDVIADHLPSGWDLDRYHLRVAELAESEAIVASPETEGDRARRAGVTWADYWQAGALLGLPLGPDGGCDWSRAEPTAALLKTCALVWRAGWRGDPTDLQACCDRADISRAQALRRAIDEAWRWFGTWTPAEKVEALRLARRPPERSKTSPPILRPGRLLRLAWEARRSRWLRREPDYFQDACDRVGVGEDREMREAIGRNWRRLDPGFFSMADPTAGPPPRPAYP